MTWGVPWVLCEAMRMFASTKPGGVDGDADDAGLVEVEYDCSGVSGVSGLVGGLGYAVLASTGMGVGFGGDVEGRAAKLGVVVDVAPYGPSTVLVLVQARGARTWGMALGP